MDKGSLVGLVVGIGLVIASILMGSGLLTFYNLPGLLIVVGGTIAATAIAFPAKELKLVVKVTRRVFHDPGNEMLNICRYLMEAMRVLKKEGPLGLEPMAQKAPTKTVGKGLQLIADGADQSTMREILSTEHAFMEEHHRVGQKIFNEMGKFAPAFGMIGTLIGLVQMLAGLDDPATLGPKMAVALLTTFYGAVMANLVFIPMVSKLDRRIGIEGDQIQLAIVGLTSIQRGDTATILRDKLGAVMAEQAGEIEASAGSEGQQGK